MDESALRGCVGRNFVLGEFGRGVEGGAMGIGEGTGWEALRL